MGGIFTVKKFHFQNDFGSILERGRNSSSKNRLFLKTSPSLVTRFTHRVLGRGWGNLFLPKIPTQKTTTKTGSVLRGTCNISSSFFDQNFDLNLGLDRDRNSEQKRNELKTMPHSVASLLRYRYFEGYFMIHLTSIRWYSIDVFELRAGSH